ncbi:hypothetical protein IEO21_10085 [Rhodonia placenta]|uniref:Uncharacterized protein n=1 Tax=Rhodonia placenta TaxID=104341 RepID=A0A8H7TXV7_9APHY|nr:hypothetical protein IEO21_10085 [Postia placenta]
MPLRYLSQSSRSPYPERSARPLNSAENSAASFASSTWAAALSSRLLKWALSAVAKAASFANGIVTPWVPSCTNTSWAKNGVAQVRASPSRRLRATCTLSLMVVNNVLTSHIGGVGVSMSPCQEGTLVMTLPATRGTEDCPRAKTAVVTVRRVNFGRSECSSGLVAATAVEATEEVWWRGDVRQGLESRRRLLTMSWPK